MERAQKTLNLNGGIKPVCAQLHSGFLICRGSVEWGWDNREGLMGVSCLRFRASGNQVPFLGPAHKDFVILGFRLGPAV